MGLTLPTKLARRQVSERAVWTVLIVVNPPRFDLGLGVFDRRELMHVQAFIPKPSVERFNKGVFDRLPWSDEVERHAAVRHQHPEIAFLDLSMPGMGGAELARRLRQQFSSNALILIALTGLSKEVAAAQGGTFDRHVLKPASPESIAVLLDELNLEANDA